MSAYDDAVAYLDAEVHPRCDYDIYSDMRDIVDEMEAENAKLREDNDRLIQAIEDLHDVSLEDRLVQLENENAKLRELCEYLWEFAKTCGADHPLLRELGMEVPL